MKLWEEWQAKCHQRDAEIKTLRSNLEDLNLENMRLEKDLAELRERNTNGDKELQELKGGIRGVRDKILKGFEAVEAQLQTSPLLNEILDED